MTIQNLKDILSATTTFTSSTISTFESGKSYEYPSAGEDIYPLLFLEEDYLISTVYNNNQPSQEDWNIALIIVDQLDDDNNKTSKDNIKDNMLIEARRVVKYLRDQILTNYQGRIISSSYLSLNDFEQDNTQGVRIELIIQTVSPETRCEPYV